MLLRRSLAGDLTNTTGDGEGVAGNGDLFSIFGLCWPASDA